MRERERERARERERERERERRRRDRDCRSESETESEQGVPLAYDPLSILLIFIHGSTSPTARWMMSKVMKQIAPEKNRKVRPALTE